MKFLTEAHRRAYEKAKAAYDAFIKLYPFTTADLDGEIWRPIPNFPKYEGSNYGRVKSFCRYPEGKILKPSLGMGVYLQVTPYKDDKQKYIFIHRMVAELFIPNPANKPQVNHKFGMKFDNYFENLEWATASENRHHAYDTGLQPQGINRPNSKIKFEEDILYIRENHDGLTQKQLAEKFGVDRATISYIQHGRTYKNTGGHIRKVKIQRVPDEDKQKILARYQRGVKGCGYESLAKEFGYGYTTIWRIVNGI